MKLSLLVTAVLAAGMLAFNPASAAKIKAVTCSGENLGKMITKVDGLADSPQKSMLSKELGMANTAMSKGDMRGCAQHMNNVARMGLT